MFTNAHHVSDSAVKASYVIAHEIELSMKPFSEGEIFQSCILKATEIVCPDKWQVFANISLSRNAIAERINDLAENLNSRLWDKAKFFAAFSTVIDESIEVVSLPAAFICGVDENMCIAGEPIELVPMRDTTAADDLFSSLVETLNKLDVDSSRAVSLATDGWGIFSGGQES